MDISIKANFSMADLEKYASQAEREFEAAQQDVLIAVGERFVNDARERGAYHNHTYNLRSSNGCEVLKNGKPVYRNFLQVGNGAKGVTDAKRMCRELRTEFNQGLVLVVVTAEGYAASVENKGKDVLTGSSYAAVKELRRLLG